MITATFIGLYLATPDRDALTADLGTLDMGLVSTAPPAAGNTGAPPAPAAPRLSACALDAAGNGHALDYIGRLARAPASYDMAQTPPPMLAPPDYYEGERANLRLFGPGAAQRAAAIQAATFARGTEVLPAPASPKRRWA